MNLCSFRKYCCEILLPLELIENEQSRIAQKVSGEEFLYLPLRNIRVLPDALILLRPQKDRR